jgi:undecaprenyl-diphosphatase
MFDLLKAAILGIVEGLTEFLPISSTGHLIVAADLLNFEGDAASTFEIFIQLGAVLAVLWYYRRDLLAQARALPTDRATQRFWLNVIIAFLPAAAIGFLLHDWIKEVLFSPAVVAVSLIAGGLIFLLIEAKPPASTVHDLADVTPKQAATIGIAQIFSMIPGVSRSGATIVGGFLSGLDRPTAVAFSFYLALPTLGLATLFDLVTNLDRLTRNDLVLMAVGLVFAFITSLLVIGWLLRYVAGHTFRIFGYYRIIAGVAILVWLAVR